jgi:methionine-rich copper-binding protein CopC
VKKPTLQLRVDTTNVNHVVEWQVVEFLNAEDIHVQRGTTSLANGAVSTTASLTTVDPATTFVLTGFRSSGSGDDMGARMLRAQLTDATTITFDRGADTDPIEEIAWQAVTLKDGSQVLHGNASFDAAASVYSETLPRAVDLNRAVALTTVQATAGQSLGRSDYTAGQTMGEASATVTLASATELRLQRGSAQATADIAWTIIEFGAP